MRRAEGHFVDETALLGDVAKNQHDAEHPARRVTDWGGRVLDAVFRGVAADEDGVLGRADDPVFSQTALRRTVARFTGRLVENMKDFPPASVLALLRLSIRVMRAATGLRNSTLPTASVVITPSPMELQRHPQPVMLLLELLKRER